MTYQAYRTLKWTSDDDSCEADCGRALSETHYVEGYLGHYCSEACRDESETGEVDHGNYEARQMGLTGLQ